MIVRSLLTGGEAAAGEQMVLTKGERRYEEDAGSVTVPPTEGTDGNAVRGCCEFEGAGEENVVGAADCDGFKSNEVGCRMGAFCESSPLLGDGFCMETGGVLADDSVASLTVLENGVMVDFCVI